jgi:23S rRNA (adenine2030-N6)-methyltransferase
LNYRHIFHAGNFADLVKHAGLTALLGRMTAGPAPLTVIDTHAGAGVYDLAAPEAVRSGEAAIDRLMADPAAPAAFSTLKAVVGKLNSSSDLRQYPGSPLLILEALRPGDRVIACELRPDDFAALERVLVRPGAEALMSDGYAVAASRLPARGPALVLIDPPFERGDEHRSVLSCLDAVLRRNPATSVMIWTPLKDLESFDGFLRSLESLGAARVLVAETRLRRLNDPMRMNGCALVVVGDPPGAEEDLRSACAWVVSALGEPGGEARIWRL